jgi:hypothetical protein
MILDRIEIVIHSSPDEVRAFPQYSEMSFSRFCLIFAKPDADSAFCEEHVIRSIFATLLIKNATEICLFSHSGTLNYLFSVPTFEQRFSKPSDSSCPLYLRDYSNIPPRKSLLSTKFLSDWHVSLWLTLRSAMSSFRCLENFFHSPKDVHGARPSSIEARENAEAWCIRWISIGLKWLWKNIIFFLFNFPRNLRDAFWDSSRSGEYNPWREHRSKHDRQPSEQCYYVRTNFFRSEDPVRLNQCNSRRNKWRRFCPLRRRARHPNLPSLPRARIGSVDSFDSTWPQVYEKRWIQPPLDLSWVSLCGVIVPDLNSRLLNNIPKDLYQFSPLNN